MLANVNLGDWAIFLGTLVPLLAAAVVAIIRQLQTGHAEIVKQMQLPSNGTTLGAGLEAIGQKQDMAIGLAHPDLNAPSFVQLARQLGPTDPTVAPDRRSTDPPPSPPSPPAQ